MFVLRDELVVGLFDAARYKRLADKLKSTRIDPVDESLTGPNPKAGVDT